MKKVLTSCLAVFFAIIAMANVVSANNLPFTYFVQGSASVQAGSWVEASDWKAHLFSTACEVFDGRPITAAEEVIAEPAKPDAGTCFALKGGPRIVFFTYEEAGQWFIEGMFYHPDKSLYAAKFVNATRIPVANLPLKDFLDLSTGHLEVNFPGYVQVNPRWYDGAGVYDYKVVIFRPASSRAAVAKPVKVSSFAGVSSHLAPTSRAVAPVAPSGPAVSGGSNAAVSLLQRQAENQFRKTHITTPEGNCALNSTIAVLELSPGNAWAIGMLDRMHMYYNSRAYKGGVYESGLELVRATRALYRI